MQAQIDDTAIVLDRLLSEVPRQIKASFKELEKENEELLEVKISCSAVNIIENLQKENKSKQKAYDDCYCEYKKYKQFDSIQKQKVKDKIEHYKELQNNYIKKYDEVNDILQGMVNVLIELLEDK